MQWQKGKSNENPSVIEFAKNSETLRLVGNMRFDDAKGIVVVVLVWNKALKILSTYHWEREKEGYPFELTHIIYMHSCIIIINLLLIITLILSYN